MKHIIKQSMDFSKETKRRQKAGMLDVLIEELDQYIKLIEVKRPDIEPQEARDSFFLAKIVELQMDIKILKSK